jgi:hypothetical protein
MPEDLHPSSNASDECKEFIMQRVHNEHGEVKGAR